VEQFDQTALLSVKDLAAALHRSTRYVWHLRCVGFEMPGGRATLADAIEFLRDHPHPSSKKRATERAVARQHENHLVMPPYDE
jgi:hypothetical protein